MRGYDGSVVTRIQRRTPSSLLVSRRAFDMWVHCIDWVCPGNGIILRLKEIGRWELHHISVVIMKLRNRSIKSGILVSDVCGLRNILQDLLRWSDRLVRDSTIAVFIVVGLRRDKRRHWWIFHKRRHGTMTIGDSFKGDPVTIVGHLTTILLLSVRRLRHHLLGRWDWHCHLTVGWHVIQVVFYHVVYGLRYRLGRRHRVCSPHHRRYWWWIVLAISVVRWLGQTRLMNRRAVWLLWFGELLEEWHGSVEFEGQRRLALSGSCGFLTDLFPL